MENNFPTSYHSYRLIAKQCHQPVEKKNHRVRRMGVLLYGWQNKYFYDFIADALINELQCIAQNRKITVILLRNVS